MKLELIINERVHQYYWDEDINCATTMVRILAEIFDLDLHEQVLFGATGMHGAGEYGAQCGLVEGFLLFIGIYGYSAGLEKKHIITLCREYAKFFESRFGSLLCTVLRPQGFNSANPPHLCEELTKEAILFAVNFVEENKIGKKRIG